MAQNPPEHTRFKKGQSGNPSGKTKLAKELLAIKTFTNVELNRVISKYLRMDKKDLVTAGNSDALPGIEIIIARTMVNAANKGDFAKVQYLIERVCGKPSEAKPETPDDGPSTQHLDGLTDEQLIAISKPA